MCDTGTLYLSILVGHVAPPLSLSISPLITFMPRLLLLALTALLAPATGLRGAPAHLRGLSKVGQGHKARWRLGTYEREGLGEDEPLKVSLQIDRNPATSCVKMVFHEANEGETRAGNSKVGYILLERRERASVLRGMRVAEGRRGQGLGKVRERGELL